MADGERSVLLKLGAQMSASGRRNLRGINRQVQTLGRLASKALNFGMAAGAGVAAGGLAFWAKGVRDAQQYGMAMAEVSTLVDTTKVRMAGLSREVLELSRATGKGPEDLSKALYQTISAGVDAGDAMAFLGKSARAAVGGVASVTDAVNLGTNVINSYGKTVEEADAIFDIAFATVKEGKTTFTELASEMGKVLPFAAQLDTKISDLFAAVATLTKGGIDTSNAVTYLKAVLSSVLKPTKEVREAAEELGLDFSATGFKARGLVGFLRELEVATGGDSEALAKLFPNVRGLGAVLALAGKQADEFVTISRKLEASAGASGEAFRKVAESDAYKFQMSLNEMKVTGIELGERTLPGLNRALQAMTPLLSRAAEFAGDLAEGMDALSTGKGKVGGMRGWARAAEPGLNWAGRALAAATGASNYQKAGETWGEAGGAAGAMRRWREMSPLGESRRRYGAEAWESLGVPQGVSRRVFQVPGHQDLRALAPPEESGESESQRYAREQGAAAGKGLTTATISAVNQALTAARQELRDGLRRTNYAALAATPGN